LSSTAEIVVDIESARGRYQYLREVGIDSPVAHLVRIRQCVARNTAANTHVIKLRARRTETRLDIAQAFPVGQLCERHAQELIPARETLEFVVAIVAIDASAKILRRKKVHQLRENRFAGIHALPPAARWRKDAARAESNSNRFQLSVDLT